MLYAFALFFNSCETQLFWRHFSVDEDSLLIYKAPLESDISWNRNTSTKLLSHSGTPALSYYAAWDSTMLLCSYILYWNQVYLKCRNQPRGICIYVFNYGSGMYNLSKLNLQGVGWGVGGDFFRNESFIKHLREMCLISNIMVCFHIPFASFNSAWFTASSSHV